jgi:hypothetical protein
MAKRAAKFKHRGSARNGASLQDGRRRHLYDYSDPCGPLLRLRPIGLLQEGTGTLTTDSPFTGGTLEENELAEFVSDVLAYPEDTWHDLLRRAGA